MVLWLIVWSRFWITLLLTLRSLVVGQTLANTNRNGFVQELSSDLRLEEIMHQINRIKRAAKNFSHYQQPSVLLPLNGTGRCVLSADKASHYCGDSEVTEVTAPPFPPPDAGRCYISSKSNREICWPRYEDLDTTCTDVGSGMVSAPVVKHATVGTMAFVPPDNLRRLIRRYYRQQGRSVPRNTTYSKNSFLFVRYECDYGYEFVDEVNSMFCINRHWVMTPPKCRGKGLCEENNGGCSHSCLSVDDREVECRCPRGLVLDNDKKNCIKPIPKNLCRILSSCSCSSIDDYQYSCTCPKGENCLLLRGKPKIYIEPAAPYEIMPGGNLNITCSAVSYPFPQIFWQRGDETVDIAPVKPGTVRSEQILIIKELYKNTQFTCHANNMHGKTERTIEIVVTGPGSAPVVRGIDAGRTSVYVRWDSPVIMNRPVTSYTVYYTNNGHQPIKNWKKIVVNEPNREVTIKDLRPNTQYFIRLRANDKLGPGRLSNPISLITRKPAVRPQLYIQEGDTIYVPPLTPFQISCNVTRADPVPKIAWYTRGRPINKPQRKKFIKMEHGGLYESTNFSCIAENEAGRTTKRMQVVVTGPTSPERIRYQIDGNNVDLQWEPPRITNGPLKNYEVLYTENANLPQEQWNVVSTDNADARSLRVTNLKEKTDYTFKLRARNDFGPGLPSDRFTLTTWLAARPPAVTISPADRIIKDPSNEELVIECEAIGVPKPKILWLWSGGLVEDGKSEFRIYDVTPSDAQDRSNSKLIAEKTNRAGVATCQAVNAHGSDEKRTEVKILGPGSPPRDIRPIPVVNGFKVTWNPPKYPNGRIVRYIIYYTKNPDDGLGEWNKTSVDGDQLEVTIMGDEDTPYNIRVQAATKDGPGIISEAYDVMTGKKPVPLTVQLIISDPPVYKGVEETIIEPLRAITFKCIAKGRPAPQIFYTWLPFNETESGQEPIPIPAYSDPKEAHWYHSLDVNTNTATKRALMCSARNTDGAVSDRHTFNVLKPGSPPENIQTVTDADNRVTISWQQPKYPNGPITGYKVFLTSDPTEPVSQWEVYDVDSSGVLQLILERGKLLPETPYYVKVVAVGQAGQGVPSDIVPFETVSGAPIDAPKDVLPTVEKDNTVDVSWTGPSIPNGPIQSYTVYFTPVDQLTSDDAYRQWEKVIVPTNNLSGGVRLDKDAYNILPNRQYRVRVSATNDLSEGPASDPVTVITGSGETPPVIRFEPAENPATVPPRGSIMIRCTATGIPMPTVLWIVGTNASDVIRGAILQLTDLRKDETATCKAENTAGQVQEVLQVLVAGPGTPPNEIVAIPLDNQQANIEWTTPDSPNGKITDYVIHYGELSTGESTPHVWKTIRVPAEEPQKHRLTGLKPKTYYAIRLQAISDRGPGVLSDPIKMRTLPLAPAIVQPADIKVHDNNTVALRFNAPRDPEDPTKPIKEFVVHYTDDDPLSESAQWKEMFWNEQDDDFSVSIPIGGEHFKPDTKYSIKVIARGEIDSPPSEPLIFQTKDGIVPPEKPQINVDAVNNMIRVRAGSDYTVSCSSAGYPPPRVTWINENGQLLSDEPMLRLQDIKMTLKAKCVAENEGGRAETSFEVFVTGPGNSPSNIRLSSLRPRTIHVSWDPPTIPNGNITRYIIYYTPLDNQDIIYQTGQIPKKAITSWMTYHKDGEKLSVGPQRADVVDFVEADTAYAVVLQAINQDGSGPYSEQHTIRTMSRAREGPPLDLRVEAEGQRSAVVEWNKPITSEQPPIGYELYYIKADAKIWEDDFASLNDWSKIPITEINEEKLHYKIQGVLEPDTEYVFRMRAIYPDGPGVFSEACITKTLPDGNAPYILISNGDHGVEGKTEITILPGSALYLSCNATGQPRPTVKWIRAGYYPIDPAWVEADEKHAKWSLKVTNITEDTSFNCVAQNSLGFANWTISVRLIPDLPLTWKNDFVIAKNENGEVMLHFTNDLPDYLREPNMWDIFWTDNPSKPFNTWNVIPYDNRPLDRVVVPEMKLGAKYYLSVEQPSSGIKTPIFEIITPKAASDIRVGTNINGETVLDFKPALATEPIRKYIIRYWPDGNPLAVMYMETPVNVTDQIVLDGLQPDADYYFIVSAKFDNGDHLPSEPVKIHTPSGDIQCDCAHACMFEEDEEGIITASCYCHNGFKLAENKKSCEHIEEDDEDGIVQVSPPTLIPEFEHPKELSTKQNIVDDLTPKLEQGEEEAKIFTSKEREEEPQTQPLPTDQYGRAVWPNGQLVATDGSGRPIGTDTSPLPTNFEGRVMYVPDQEPTKIYATDVLGRILPPVVSFDGSPLPINEYGEVVDNLGNPIVRNDAGEPVGPGGIPLRQNYKGEFIYPMIGKDGQPLPTDANMRPIFSIIGPNNQPFQQNEEGLNIDQDGQMIPTDSAGHPISVDGSPYPTDEWGRYVVLKSDITSTEIVPTDELGRSIYMIIYPDGRPLPTSKDGRFVDSNERPIPTNEIGVPLNEMGEVLMKESEGKFVYAGDYILPTDSSGRLVKIQYAGKPLRSDKSGRIIGPFGEIIPVNEHGHPIDRSSNVLPTILDGTYVLLNTTGKDTVSSELEQKQTDKVLNIIGPDGHLLPMTKNGTILDPFGRAIPTNDVGEAINYRNEPLPTDTSGRVIYPKDGLSHPLPPTDRHGRPVYAVIGPDGRQLLRDSNGAIIGPDGQILPTNLAGIPVNSRGQPLPSDKSGNIIYSVREMGGKPLPTDSTDKPIYPVITPDERLSPQDESGKVVDLDGKPIPTNVVGVPVDEKGKLLPVDQNGYIKYPNGGAVQTEKAVKPFYTVLGPDGKPLAQNDDGSIIDPYGKPLPTDTSGYPVNRKGKPLPQDRFGNIIYPANDIDAAPLPTDYSGKPVYLVIGSDGRFFPKNHDGAVVDPGGRPIPTNAAGVPIDHRGKPLPVDRNGYVIYPTEGYESEVSVVDSTGISMYTVLGPDGTPLPRNEDGFVLDPFGRPIPTDSSGYPVDNHGKLLPRDQKGNMIYPVEGLHEQVILINGSKEPIDLKVRPDGNLLLESDDGKVLDPYNSMLSTSTPRVSNGKKERPVFQDHKDSIIYPVNGLNALSPPNDNHTGPDYPVVDYYGHLLPTNFNKTVVDSQRKPIPTNAVGVPVDWHGRPLQQNENGRFLYPTDIIYDELLPTDRSGKPIYPFIGPDGEWMLRNDDGTVVDFEGYPIPTNEAGIPVDSRRRFLPRDKTKTVIHPVEPLIIDYNGKLHPVKEPDGELLPTDKIGAVSDLYGELFSTSAAGVSISNQGGLLPTAHDENATYLTGEVLKIDTSPLPAVLGSDGRPLPTSDNGMVIGPDGNFIPTNKAGILTNYRGQPLPKDKDGNIIYPAKGLWDELQPTDSHGRPVYTVIGVDGEPLLTNADGVVIGSDGKPLPTNGAGFPVNTRGEMLPTDRSGNVLYPAMGLIAPLPTMDINGRPLYPVIGPDGHILPTTADGEFIGPEGDIVPINAAGVPINHRGEVLPNDGKGKFIYPATGLDEKLPRTGEFGNLIYSVVNHDGIPLPTTKDGTVLGPEGSPIPTNEVGVPLDKNGKPLPKDSKGNLVYKAASRPTNQWVLPVFSVIRPDGELLPTDEVGEIKSSESHPIPTNEKGRFTNDRGELMPTDYFGNAVYPAKDLDAEPFSTGENGRHVYPVTGPDGEFLSTYDKGQAVDNQGKLLPTNVAGLPIGEHGQPLLTDSDGDTLHKEIEISLPTDKFEEIVYPVAGPNEKLFPTDKNDAIIGPDGQPFPTDKNGVPVDSRGKQLPRDFDGRIIYPRKDSHGEQLLFDLDGQPIYPQIRPDGKVLPTNGDGVYVNESNKVIPTNVAEIVADKERQTLRNDESKLPKLSSSDKLGRLVHQTIGSDDILLQQTTIGQVVDSEDKSIPIDRDDQDQPLHRKSDGIAIFPTRGFHTEPPPTDESGKPINAVTKSNGFLMSRNEKGLPVGSESKRIPMSDANKFVGPDALLPTDQLGRIIHLSSEEMSTVAATESGHNVYPAIDTEGKSLDRDSSGAYIIRNGVPVKFDTHYLPTDHSGNVLSTDSNGNYIYPVVNNTEKLLPTHEAVAEIATVEPDGGLMLTTQSENGLATVDSTRRFSYTKEVTTTEARTSDAVIASVVDEKSPPLSTEKTNRYLMESNRSLDMDIIDRLVEPDDRTIPFDDVGNYAHSQKIEPGAKGVDDYGQPLPTNEDNFNVRKNGPVIPIEPKGFSVDEQGLILPTNADGIFVKPKTKLPTDLKQYQIMNDGNQPLPTDKKDAFQDSEVYGITENEHAKPISVDGFVLSTTKTGYYTFHTTSKAIQSTGKDGISLETKPQYVPSIVGSNNIESTSADIVESLHESVGRLLPTDESGHFVVKEGKKVITNDTGRPAWPDKSVQMEATYLTESRHLPNYSFTGFEGESVATIGEKSSSDLIGHPIPTSRFGRPLDKDVIVAPTDAEGNDVFRKKCSTYDGVMDIVVAINVGMLDNDSFEHIKKVIRDLVDKYFDLAPDMTQFSVVKYSGTAEVPITLGGYNEKMELLQRLSQVEINQFKDYSKLNIGLNAAKQQFVSFGRSNVGKLILVVTNGEDIYPEDGISRTIPMLVVGKSEFEEEIKDWTESFILVDSWKKLRADIIAKMIETECISGRIFIPLTRTSPRPRPENFTNVDGSPLPTDEFGRVFIPPTTEPTVLATDEYGHIIYSIRDPAGKMLPTNEVGSVINRLGEAIEFDDNGKPIGPDKEPLPTDESGFYIYPAIDNYGKPLPTDVNKRPIYKAIDTNGESLPTSESGIPVDASGQPISTDSSGKYIDLEGLPYPTDSNGNIIVAKQQETISKAIESTDFLLYPVIRPNNMLVSTDASSSYMNGVGQPIGRTGDEELPGRYGNPIPTSEEGAYISPKLDPKGESPPTDSNIYSVVETDSLLPPVTENDLPLMPDSSTMAVDFAGKPSNTPSGSLLPSNEYGQIYFQGPDSEPFSSNETRAFVDNQDVMSDSTDLHESKFRPVAPACNNTMRSINIIFIVESSDATRTKFSELKRSLLNFITRNAEWNVSRFGIISYANTVAVNLNIGNLQNYRDLKEAIYNMPVIGNSSSGDEHAMRTALQLLREKYDGNSGELIIHIYKTPISSGAQILTDHLTVNETVAIISLGSDQWYRLQDNNEINKLRSDMCLMFVKSHLAQTEKLTAESRTTTKFGNNSKPNRWQMIKQPTSVDVNRDRRPLSTIRTGLYIKPNENFISTDSGSRSVDANGSLQPTDNSENYMIQMTEFSKNISPTPQNGHMLYPIVDADQQPHAVDRPTASINSLLRPVTSDDAAVFLAPNANKSSLIILYPDGRSLPTDGSGKYVDENGQQVVHIDENGRPVLSAEGTVLQKTANGNYLYPYEPGTSRLERPGFVIVSESGYPLPTDTMDHYLDPEGRPIRTNSNGEPIDTDGRPLSKDEHANYVWTVGVESKEEYNKTPSGINAWSSPTPHCVVTSNADLLIVLDASSNIKIVDYRIMKDFIEKFLLNHFDLRRNYIRVGVIKYGDKVEIPVPLGDYENHAQLFSKISETNRMRGAAHLGDALREASREFFGSKRARIVIIFSNGPSSDDPGESARLLRENMDVHIFLVYAGNQGNIAQNLAIVDESNPHRIVTIDEWHEADTELLGAFADELCKLLPQMQNRIGRIGTWPTRLTKTRLTTPVRLCKRIDFQADVMFVLDSSDSTAPDNYANLKEGINTLIDETFDLSPDIVRVGFVEYSDKASVPVPLGHYDDKIQLLMDISNSELLGGTAIISKGLYAAKQQFLLHGREGVSRILLLVTNGVNRGDAAHAIEDLRTSLNVNIFILAVNASHETHNILNRLVGNERVMAISVSSNLQGPKLLEIVQTLCYNIEPRIATIQPPSKTTHRTTKREVAYVVDSMQKENTMTKSPLGQWKSTTKYHFAPTALCSDGFLRPYQLSVVIDITARSPEKDFRLVLDYIANFLKARFLSQTDHIRLNLVGVDSNGIKLREANFGIDTISEKLAKVKQTKGDEISPKLGQGIAEAVSLATEYAIKGVNQIIVIVSSDGTSSDEALSSVEYARDHYGHGMVTISIRAPASELLKELALGSATRVVHFSDWSTSGRLFDRWIAHAICNYVTTPITRRTKMTRMTRPPSKGTTAKLSVTEPTNIEVKPISPNSFSVSWTCCTNNRADYAILFTPDARLPKENWQRADAKCRDSFGKTIDGLPTNNFYTVCVLTAKQAANKSVPMNFAECAVVELNKETKTPPDFVSTDSQNLAPCQCVCMDNGKAVIQPACRTRWDPLHSFSTLPPALDGECKCSISARSGQCPRGYDYRHGQCYDINECQQQNGGCSHGCVNIPGDFYCACPYGMIRDPVDPKTCINVTGSFDRIVALLGQYLSANRIGAKSFPVEDDDRQSNGKIRYKATVTSADDKTISFEWSSMPAVVRRAFKWLF